MPFSEHEIMKPELFLAKYSHILMSPWARSLYSGHKVYETPLLIAQWLQHT